jgi:hypothetical protein
MDIELAQRKEEARLRQQALQLEYERANRAKHNETTHDLNINSNCSGLLN